nr:hypothetical protein [Tanacetum cinerariifolium]
MESDPSEDPSSDHIPPLPAISPFLSSTDDFLDSNTPDTPPSPTHGTSFTEMTLSTPSTLVASGALRRRVMILSHGQPIPYGRPYRYHPNGPVHMMIARKRVELLPTHRLALRHSIDYSSLDHFALDDSSRDSSSSSPSSSSSNTSLDPSSDDLSDSLSDHSLPAPSSGMRPSHQLCSLVPSIPCSSAAISDRPSHDSSSTSPSRKRSRSFVASVSLSSPIHGSLSSACVDILPSPKRIRSPESAMDLEVSLVKGSELSRVRRIDARVVVETVDREEIKTGARGLVKVKVDRVTHQVIADDILEPAQEEGAVKVMYETLGDLVQRIVATGQQSTDILERIRELERDNIRLRDMMDVESQRVTRSQHRESRVQREMRQMRCFRFYDRIRIVRLEACARRTMPNIRSGASRTHEGINKQIDRRLAGALGARDAARNLEPLIKGGGEKEEGNGNGRNGNGGNGYRGNGNRG